MQIQLFDQQKAAWFKSDDFVSCASYIAILVVFFCLWNITVIASLGCIKLQYIYIKYYRDTLILLAEITISLKLPHTYLINVISLSPR